MPCKCIVVCCVSVPSITGYDMIMWPSAWYGLSFICGGVFWQLLSPPPLFVSPYTASRFPQCSANITTKMAVAMEKYEKEAGCVPILHPEVWSSDFTPSHTHINIPKTYYSRLRLGGCVILLCFYGNSDVPCKTTGGGWQVANGAKGANPSPPPPAA